ncbi:MAG: M20/M25/M40 family metallo-hydrolase [Planctomycetota bacterium]|nr:M20/M25/M40 family metallo-hydrolase [Planctomycetota bacterium]
MLLSAHLDTVFPPSTSCEVRQEDGHWIGPGIGDNCTGMSILMTAARLLVAHGCPFAGELIVAANVGEEGLGNLYGMRALCQRLGAELDAALALDGGLGHIVGAAVGSIRYRIRVKGPGGHSWSDFGKPSALHHLARIAAELARLEMPAQPRSTFNIGVIQGGTSINTIAPEAELQLDLRSVDPDTLQVIDARARAAVHAVPCPSELSVELEELGRRPAGDPDLTTDWVDVGRAVWEALGIPVKITASSTDANIPLSLGLRASTIGTHRGGGAHTENEWIDPQSLPKGLEAVLLAVLAGLAIFPAEAGAHGEVSEAAGDD